MFKRFRHRLHAFYRFLEQASAEQRTVLAVTTDATLQMELRICAIQERWHILFARSITSAIQLRRLYAVTVILYDHEFPDVDWRKAVRQLTSTPQPTLFILLAPMVDRYAWKAVLDNGGYDLAGRLTARGGLAGQVNGAFSLLSSLELLGEETPAVLRKVPPLA